MTNGDGQVVMDQDYMPFGADLPRVDQIEVQNDIDMTYKYTGQSKVVSIGLYYYKARYYDQSIGRFITEDTYQGELNNPQSQNLYVYVMNNPMKYIDPSGNVAVLPHKISSWIRDKTAQVDARTTFSGIVRMVGGGGQVLTGLGLFKIPEPGTSAAGLVIIGWGTDNFMAGFNTTRQGLKGGDPTQSLIERGMVFTGGTIGEMINDEVGREWGENIGQITYISADLGISLYGSYQSAKDISNHIQETRKMTNMIRGDSAPRLNFVIEGSNMTVQPFSNAYSPGLFLSTNQLAGNLVMIGNDLVAYPDSIDDLKELFKELNIELDLDIYHGIELIELIEE